MYRGGIWEGLVDDYGRGSLPRHPTVMRCAVGSRASETLRGHRFIRASPGGVLLILSHQPFAPFQHLSFPRSSDELFSPYQVPLQLSIHRTIFILSNLPTRSLFRRQQPQTSPDPYPVGDQEGSMSQCDIDSDSGPFGYIVFCIFFKPNGRIFHSSTPHFIPRILGCAASFPLHVCILWIDLLQSWLFYYPPSPPLAPSLTPVLCAFGPRSPKLESYLRIVLHALDSLYDTCVQASLSLSPPPPSSPNILSLVLARIPLRPFFLLPGFCRWDWRGLRVARWVVIACAVCNVCGLQ